jgi:hypothetical protein
VATLANPITGGGIMIAAADNATSVTDLETQVPVKG